MAQRARAHKIRQADRKQLPLQRGRAAHLIAQALHLLHDGEDESLVDGGAVFGAAARLDDGGDEC